MIKALAAAVAALLAVLLISHQYNARLSDQLTASKAESEQLRMSIERAEEALNGYRQAHKRDAESLAKLSIKNEELRAYVAALPNRDAECLSPDDTYRLRSLWAE